MFVGVYLGISSSVIQVSNLNYPARATEYANGTVNIDDGKWHMITVTYSSNTYKIYVDGEIDTSTGSFTAPSYHSTNYVTIGGDIINGTPRPFYVGNIDDLSYFSRVLTADEINNLYTGEGWTSIKSINGLVKASVKSFNNLAIASVKKINGLA